MRSITFGQALLALGLIGLTLPLTAGQGGLSYVGAAYSSVGGPSPIGPIMALAATLAVAIVILVTGLARIRAEEGAGAPLTYPQLLVTIGLLGLLVAGALSPMSVVFSIATGWDERSWWTSADAGPLALQAGAFVIPLLVVASNLKGALRSPSANSVGITKPLTCLAVLALVSAAAAAPVGAVRHIPHLVFSGRYSTEVDGPFWSGVDIGMAPELVSLVLVALAIPLAVLLVLRWKDAALASAAYAGPLVITAALLVASAGILGVFTLLFFGLPLAALLWPLSRRSPGPANTPSRLTTGQLLAWVALICLASTTTQVYSLVFTFTFTDSSDLQPFPGPVTALALAYAISFAVLAVATAKLRGTRDVDAA